jgi:hypothetical protein
VKDDLDNPAWESATTEDMPGSWQSLIPPVVGVLRKHSLPGQPDRWSMGYQDGSPLWVNSACTRRIL